MIAIIAAAAAIATGAPDWCIDEKATDTPRNVESQQACAAAGVSVYIDRMTSFSDGPQTCENAAKHLSENADPGGDPPQVGDGYWVESWGLSKPTIRCHIVKIDGKTITMR